MLNKYKQCKRQEFLNLAEFLLPYIYVCIKTKEVKKENADSFWHPVLSYGMAAILDCHAWR